MRTKEATIHTESGTIQGPIGKILTRSGDSLLIVVTLPLALTGVVLACALAVITNSIVLFTLVPLLVAIIFVFLVVVLLAVVAVIPSNQNVSCLSSGQSSHD